MGLNQFFAGRHAAGLFLAWCLTVGHVSAELPPEIIADRYLIKAERMAAEKDARGAIEMMKTILDMQSEHGFALPGRLPLQARADGPVGRRVEDRA